MTTYLRHGARLGPPAAPVVGHRPIPLPGNGSGSGHPRRGAMTYRALRMVGRVVAALVRVVVEDAGERAEAWGAGLTATPAPPRREDPTWH